MEDSKMKRGIFAVAIWMLMLATPAVGAQKNPKPSHVKAPAAAKSVVKPTAAAKPSPKVHAKTSVKVAKSQPKTNAKSNVKTNVKTKSSVKTNTKVAKSSKTATATTTTTTTSTTSTPTGTLSPVQQKLKKNTNLAAKLQGRLPAGTDLMKAAAGFRNLGQFVAAVNASYNQKLSFVELKQRMVVEGMSLGQAKKDLQGTTTTSPTTTTTVRR
jgi:hypothetical protein